MMSAVSTARLGSEFEKFLYAAVGEDHNGMPLTVLSALARVDVDPWEEAAILTRLPEDRAVTQLACLLGALRDAPRACPDPARIAAPLIALLPRHRDHAAPVLVRASAQAAPTKHRAAVSTLLSVLTYLIFILFSQWLMGSLQVPRQTQSPATSEPATNSSHPPTSSEAP
jgi:hypothetical protein